ncbi:MAG TPA: glucose-6-phosphate isomerase [Rectinemataceae bacterium]|nr:glucose-6-phosphate isomerase [Rectinemataceae bacterium]
MTRYDDLDRAPAWDKLRSLGRPRLGELLSPARIASSSIPMGGGLSYNWAASPVDEAVLALLGRLAEEQELVAKYRLLLDGEVMNTGEQRMVLHHLARGQLGRTVSHEGRDQRQFYEGERLKAADFARSVHGGRIRGSSGKAFSTVTQIGIGGSDLGPRALYLALERWARANGKLRMEARFISNVDPDDANAVLERLDLETSLFVLVSKSGTTQETLANESLLRERLRARGLDPAKHIVAVTSETSPLARNPGYLASFYIDDFIGGRYSSSSMVGGVVLSLALGSEAFADFLAGAHAADRAALEGDISRNAALLDAMIGVYERSVLGYPCTVVLPYAEALSRFPAHLQQLDMESNGKRVNRRGEALSYSTGPVVFGEPGTNGQHSFYQLLHQGTDPLPLQFIGFLEGQTTGDCLVEGSTSRQKLNANLAAQIVAFARGKADANGNRHFPGERPSSLILGRQLEPASLGALLAHYENKVMFQGFAWNINSFDQEGVQLGKVLAKKALTGLAEGAAPASGDPVLDAYAKLLLGGRA